MGELKIDSLIEPGQIEQLKGLDTALAALLKTYTVVATELAKGIKMEVNTPKDLEKLYALYTTQSSNANKASVELNATLDKQKQVLQEVADSLQKKVAAGDLSAKEMKALTDASSKNAEALEKVAKADLAAAKAQNVGNTSKKNVIKTEEDRQRVVKEAIALSNKDVHSIQEANEANIKLRQAVKLLRDTDEGYAVTLARLNSTIGINTDYVKRNSDRYTKQKMTIGAYREEVKAAIIDLGSANNSMKNLGIIAKGCGGILKTKLVGGFNDVSMSVGKMVKGFIGAQAVIAVATKLFQLLKEGVNTAIDFEAANSKLAAILGTTADKTKNLQLSARELGATTKYTAAEATNLQIELAKLGFTANEIQQSTKYILQFAQATGSDLPEAAALAGASIRMFNADTSETERYVSAMAVATTKSALSFSYLQTAMPIAGSVAKTFGFEIEDVLALLGKLADAGVDASSAATATRNILLNLANGGGKLSKTLGGNIRTLDDFTKGLQGAKDKGMELAEMLDITDKRSVNAFANFVNGANDIDRLRKSITGVTEEFGKMASEMSNNTAGSLKNLSSAWEELMISVYGNTGAIRTVIDMITSSIRYLSEALESAQTKAEKIVNKASAATAGEIDYQKDIDSIERRKKAAIEAGKTETDAQRISLVQQNAFLEKALEKGNQLREKAQNRYNKMLENSNNENYKFQDQAKIWLQSDARELAGFTEYTNKIEARLKKVQNLLKENSDTGKVTGALTDEQKKELEKQAKERQRILEAMQQSELDLMDEGLKKELSKIALGYNKKIAAIRGNSAEEQKTRENLAIKLQQDLGDYEVDFYLKKEQERIQNKLAVVKKGSDEEYKLQLSLLDIQEETEKESAIRKNEDILAVEEKYAKRRLELNENHAIEKTKKLEEEYAARFIIVNVAMSKELDELTAQYKKGEINAETYERNKAGITRKYMLQQLETALELAKIMSDMPGLSDEDKLKMKQKVAEAEIALSNAVRDTEVADTEDAAKAHQKWLGEFANSLDYMNDVARDALGDTANIFGGLSKILKSIVDDGKLDFKDLAEAAITMLSGINDVVQKSYSMRIEKVEEEQEANEEAKEKDIERIEHLAETGAISEEEAEVRKRAAEEKTAAKNAELDKKKQAMAKKQAVWDKTTSIAQAGIATALAIAKSLPNFILAAIVGAMGAIQIATIAATPIPSYAEGTKNSSHPGGKALVGDGGKREVVMYKGLAWITPDTPMLADLPCGAKVFPDVTEAELPEFNLPGSDIPFIADHFGGVPAEVRNTIMINNLSGLERRIDETNRLLEKEIKMRRRRDSDDDFERYIRSKI